MDMMSAAFLSIAITTISVTTLMAGLDAIARAKLARRVPSKRKRGEFRRQATPRVVGFPQAARRVPPQFLPALQRARMMRGRMAYLAVTAPQRRRLREHFAVRSSP